MKYYLLILAIITFGQLANAQSTPWYYGGKSDGHASVKVTNFSPSVLSNQVVYAGAKGDGASMTALSNFTPTVLKQQIIYAGQKGDGGSAIALNNFIPTALAHHVMYNGNKGDGASFSALNNFSPSIVKQYVAYFGGKGDGWSNQLATAWALPLVLLSFDGKAQGAQNLLTWKTSYEENVDYFLVEKSKNAVEFEGIGQVEAKGNTIVETSYQYIDKQDVQGVKYYRLKMTDQDQKYTYSKVIRLVNEKLDYSIILSPNPANNNIRMSFSRALENHSRFMVYDMNGKIVINSDIEKDESVKNIDISSLSAGSYLIQVQTPNENVSMPFIKQ